MFSKSNVDAGLADLRRDGYRNAEILMLGQDAYNDLKSDPRFDEESDSHGEFLDITVARRHIISDLSDGGVMIGKDDDGGLKSIIVQDG